MASKAASRFVVSLASLRPLAPHLAPLPRGACQSLLQSPPWSSSILTRQQTRLAHAIPRPPRPQPSSSSSPPSSSSTYSTTTDPPSDLESPTSSTTPPPQAHRHRRRPSTRSRGGGPITTRPQPERPPHYQLTFTCVPCGHRSQHNVSKQGYHHGSVLITCPECRNRHVISDHLGIFGDRKMTVEDLMREKGRLVKKGTLGEDGNIELWPEEEVDAEAEAEAAAGAGEKGQ